MKKPMILTVGERVLIHLYDYKMDYEYEAPFEITQKGIAESVGVELKNLSRSLKKLELDGLLVEKKARMKGGRQKKKIYSLSRVGREFTSKIIGKIEELQINFKNTNGKIKKITLRDAKKRTNQSILTILQNLDENLMFTPPAEKKFPVERKKIQKHYINAYSCIELGRAFADKNDIEKAIGYYEKSVEFLKDLPISTEKIRIYHTIGDLYLKKNKYSEAKNIYEECKRLGEVLEEPTLVIKTSLKLADVHLKMKNNKEANTLLEETLAVAKKIEDFKTVKKIEEKLKNLKSCEGS